MKYDQHLPIFLLLLCFMVRGEFVNSDSELYTEDVYNKLKEEYVESEEPSPSHTKEINVEIEENLAAINELMALNSVTEKIETYDEAVERLSCDNPWFWNAFECFWLDFKNKNFTKRTTRNGKVVAMIAGPVIGFIVLSCCCLICMAFLARSRVKKLKNQIDTFQKKYRPGTIVLPTGEIKSFPPTVEEEEALENLLQTLSSIV